MEETGNIVIYESEGGDVRLDVRLENGNVWLTQQQMALLYDKVPSTINEHIRDIFDDKELLPEACRKKFGYSEFQQKAPYYYNLDMIIAVGFRVRSTNFYASYSRLVRLTEYLGRRRIRIIFCN